MSTATAPRPPRMSFEEFLVWADEDTRAEWVDGEVLLMSPASDRHQDLLGLLVACVRAFAEAHQAGVVRFGPYVMKVPGSAREPDLIFVAEENRGRITTNYLDGPADLAVEIVSPDSRTRDRRDKLREYESAGVREYWLIDPEREQAEFYHLAADGRYATLPVEDGIVRSLVLPGLWLRVDWLWQESLPPLLGVLREWGLV